MVANLIFTSKTSLGRVAFCGTLLLVCQLLYGQMNQNPRPRRDSSSATGAVSDLARENLDLVAASSIQIREVPVKDAGLLVELKRWVAKEASDNGQVVRESDLTESAIFERLDR